ncbi:MAG: J domain-containing protein [Saprospiraceae bacterium]
MPHDHFTREGNNIIHELFINFADAALGNKVEVPTLDGLARISIPAGTQGGKIFRLKDKGLPALQSYQRGDLLVHVNVWTLQKAQRKGKQANGRTRENRQTLRLHLVKMKKASLKK